MIKKLLTIATVVLTVAVNAQTNGRVITSSSSEAFPASITAGEKVSASVCNTLTVFNPTANVTIYTAGATTAVPGCSPKAGYVFGSNCFGVTEHASHFAASNYATLTSPSITAVSVGFYKNVALGRGTSGTTGTVGMQIYAGTSNASAPGAAVTSTSATLANILAAQTNTASSLFIYTFTFTPFAIPASGFYASVVIPTNIAAGDTAALYTQTATVNNSWEKVGATWSDVFTDWGLNTNHVFIPIVCGNSVATGISKNLGLSKDVTIMPNPSTGLVNVLINLAQTENISLTVTNALGQQVLSNKYDGISTEYFSLDLTNQANGVYFVTVSNGKDKMVQRLIINK